MIQIFVESISERLLYTLDFVFKERGLEYTLTNDHHTFIASDCKKINYSERFFDNIIQLIPSCILFDEEIIIYVSDTGPGIPDNEKERIFHRFFRLGNEDTRATKGTGIGLYLVKQLVQMQNGSIKALNNRPVGTRFELRFPVFKKSTQ